MDSYDPLIAPDPAAWLELDEGERLQLILEFHERTEDEPPPDLHAMIHTVVENQLALGAVAVREAIARLMNEKLDRHEAIHAVGSVLAEFLFDALRRSDSSTTFEAGYYKTLGELTAEKWRSTG